MLSIVRTNTACYRLVFLRSPKCQQQPQSFDTWTTSFSWYTAEISGLAFEQDACLIFLYHVCRTLYIQSLISSLNGWGQFYSCQEFMIFLQPTSCYYARLCLDLTEILLSCMQSCHLCSQCTHYPQTFTNVCFIPQIWETASRHDLICNRYCGI